jgi:hypothetical protein
MTRETKIGLGVAGSFICLVCIVVASKWRGGDVPNDPGEPSEPKIAAAKPAPNPSTSDPKKNGVPNKEPAAKTPTAPVLPPSAFPDPPMTLPPLIPVGETRNDGPPQLPKTTVDLPAPPMLPPAANDGKGAAVVTPPMLPAPPLLPPESTPSAGDNKPPAVITFPPPARPVEPPDFPAPPNLGAFGPTTPIADAQKPKVIPPAAKDHGSSIAPLDTKFPVPPSTPSPGITVVPPNDPPSLLPPPRIGAGELPSTPPISTLPERGPNPGVFAPPAVINAGNPPMPVVKDVSVDLDACLPGETHFGLVALRFYGNDKYAEALLEYNKRHATQIRNGSVILTNPRSLPTGQQVLRPPVGILERDFGALIPGARPTGPTVPTIPSNIPAVKLSTPSPLVASPGVAAVSNPPVAGSSRSYRVQNPSGESILDIAERQLGDRGRWNEIYRLNPNYQPQFRIPVGTELKMPG